MNRSIIYVLKALRYGYTKMAGRPRCEPLPVFGICDGNNIISEILQRDNPCMIARYGATELLCLVNYLAIKKHDKNLWRYIKRESDDWWWNPKVMAQMEQWSGFFPSTEENLTRFCELMISDSLDLDIVAVIRSTMTNVSKLQSLLQDKIKYINLVSLDSFVSDKPWSRVLEGLNVLVIHPFAELIERQYFEHRDVLFINKDVLPLFNLRTVKAVQSLGGTHHGYNSWFEALDWMKDEMDKEPYDIALIGCGAYGFPLAAHAKRTGHKAVHIGGALQLLFGIKGKRWEDPVYGTHWGIPQGTYSALMNNPYWVRPDEYRIKQSNKVENACYW